MAELTFLRRIKWGRPSFKRVLTSIANAYRDKFSDVTEQSKLVEQSISQSESFLGRSATFSPRAIDAIVQSALGMFDPKNGGFEAPPSSRIPARSIC